ncbi:MAG: hypothetical protein C0467_07500 [Planctomycetaceae bacterium]|nr:hypothetical protein [Planctomycetaceae bacterium]
MMPCPSADAIAQAAVDPDAAPPEVLEHIAVCARCRQLLDRVESPVNWNWLNDTEPKHEPKTRFLDRLKAAVRYTVGEPTERDEVGPKVPGHTVEAEIARGGMGVVYRAKDTALGRVVAIKALRQEFAANTAQLARFVGEAKALAALQHPNVVQLFHVGESGGQPYIVMEYVPGGTLRHAMKGDPWEPAVAARFIRTLADATAAVHKIGVIHRDLKPGNVLMASDDQLTPDGKSTTRPKIADFGLARFLNAVDHQTRTGDVFGTPEFMAPEQARGDHRKVGPETDVWALGVILYELLTGRVPFTGETAHDTLELVKDGTPASPELLRPGVRRELAAICMKCLEKPPQRRYRAAADLRDDLDQFLAGRTVSALPRSWAGRVAAAVRRNPLTAIGWLLIVVALLGTLGWGAWERHAASVALAEAAAQYEQMSQRHEHTTRELYATRIDLVTRALAAGNTTGAKSLLTACLPVAGDPDQRGWEWYYLSNRLLGPARIDLRLSDADRHGFDDVKLHPNTETLSADGRRRVVIDATGQLVLYDQDRRVLLHLPAAPGRAVGVKFSKDGRWLAARTAEDAVVVYDGGVPP